MAVNLINSNDIEVEQTGQDIQLNLTQQIPIIDNTISTSSTNGIENQAITKYVNNIKGSILWTNPNPTSSFSAGTITLNESLDNYDMYELIFKIGNGATDPLVCAGKIPIASGFFSTVIGDNIYYRSWTQSGSSLNITDASRITSYPTGKTTNNNGLLPMYVIGYKTGLFE